jgi:hypothetical protein
MPFSQQIPKPISDKISNYLESNKEKDGKNGKTMAETVKVLLTNTKAVTIKTKQKSSTILTSHNFTGD